MTVHDLRSLGVGKTLTTGEFMVRPADLTAHVESSFLGQVVGTCEECLSTGSLTGGAVSPLPWGRVCPTSVGIDRVLAALTRHEARSGVPVTVRSVGRVRSLGVLLVGEPITATAALRFRSDRNPGSTHLTLEVEVHHWHAGHRTMLLGFEVGLELHAAADPAAA